MVSNVKIQHWYRRFVVAALGTLVLTTAAAAQSSLEGVGTRWPAEDVAPLTTELVMELRPEISPPIQVGESDAGHRKFIPITGGYFVGDRIRGRMLTDYFGGYLDQISCARIVVHPERPNTGVPCHVERHASA